ncbi:RNA polymerase sigma factor [Arenicella chitinivorans]|uniref:RNA polymerase sigma factor n=1 Tax=Arenicella chitinivorans TaxID=1329800 RepID=A0A918RMS4_9GAMM|nr:RNA polymerase sigma factor [Arenicella chitinivorans]GHA03560.1 RNA polymerase sigma factor [Arenicella chitinivorans]
MTSKYAALPEDKLVVLVQTTLDGDAFSALVSPLAGELQAFLTRLTGNPTRAEDLGQNTLWKAYRKIDRFAGKSSFKTWLFSIAYHEFLQAQRKTNSITRLINAVSERVCESAESNISQRLDLQRALDALSIEERAALLLAEAYGFSHPEIASTLALPLGTVKTLIRRAKSKLAKKSQSHQH